MKKRNLGRKLCTSDQGCEQKDDAFIVTPAACCWHRGGPEGQTPGRLPSGSSACRPAAESTTSNHAVVKDGDSKRSPTLPAARRKQLCAVGHPSHLAVHNIRRPDGAICAELGRAAINEGAVRKNDLVAIPSSDTCTNTGFAALLTTSVSCSHCVQN